MNFRWNPAIRLTHACSRAINPYPTTISSSSSSSSTSLSSSTSSSSLSSASSSSSLLSLLLSLTSVYYFIFHPGTFPEDCKIELCMRRPSKTAIEWHPVLDNAFIVYWLIYLLIYLCTVPVTLVKFAGTGIDTLQILELSLSIAVYDTLTVSRMLASQLPTVLIRHLACFFCTLKFPRYYNVCICKYSSKSNPLCCHVVT